MLKKILAITGKPGLFKLISRGNNMLIVESLLDGKRTPTYARDKIVALSEVSMFTTGEDARLSEVLTAVSQKEEGKQTTIDPKKADNNTLFTWFDTILPEWDRDRVYPSDIRKLIQWYNILINAGITDFSIQEDEDEELTNDTPKIEEKTTAPKTQVKTQKSAASSAKTGVGARKG